MASPGREPLHAIDAPSPNISQLVAEPIDAIIKPAPAGADVDEEFLRQRRQKSLAMIVESSESMRMQLISIASMTLPVLNLTSLTMRWGLVPVQLGTVSR